MKPLFICGPETARFAVATACAVFAATLPAMAWCQAAVPPAEPAAPVAPAAAPSPPAARAIFGEPATPQRLTNSRGGSSTNTSTQVDISGVLKDATATNVSTGSNAIRDGSFTNAVGFNTVIQNSGANVLIQNSMTVNVQFK